MKRFHIYAPAAIIGVIGLVAVVTTSVASRLLAGQVAGVEDQQFRQMRTILEFNWKAAEDRALSRAELVASLPAVRMALGARNRAQLLAETALMYKGQAEKFGIEQAMFSIPPATSFLRLNNPAKFDEDLTFRPLVVAVNRDQVARSGLSIGRAGPAIFGEVPVFDMANKHVGAFEMGVGVGGVLDRLKDAFGFDMAFFVLEKPVREIATNLAGEVLDEHNRVGEYLKYHATNWALIRQLATGADLSQVNGEPVNYVRESLGKPYGVVLVGVRNPAGAPLGIVAVTSDFAATRGAAASTRASLWASALVGLIVLAAVVLIVVRGFLLRPLAELQALSAKAEDSEAKS
jgi:methyl-accepting chemotaxis protein